MKGRPQRAATDDLLDECEQVLEYRFRDRDLLRRCLTHASVARTRLASNERLEFLGDAILGLVVCEMLYRRFPEEPEGEMTRIKSSVVSRTCCARLSDRLGLHRFLIVGKGLSGRRSYPMSVKAAVVESLIAGLYLDGGLEVARSFIEKHLSAEVEEAAESVHGRNYKSVLQQYAQRSLGAVPTYRLLDEKGPDHSKCFKLAATIGSRQFPPAWGASKKEAEQRAARNALCELEGKAIPHPAD